MIKKVSLKDIAEKVGVSVALVSYVLNNRFQNRIGKEVAQKIRTAAEELNYRPNQIAKSLKINKTNTIGLIVADIANPFSSILARIIEDAATKEGYTVISGSSDEDLYKFKKLTDTFINRQVDGLIMLPPEGAEQQLEKLKQINLPFVIVDRYFPKVTTNCVNVDNFKAAYDAVKQFIINGNKRIAMIGYSTQLHHLNDRVNGYTQALKDACMPLDKNLLQKVHIKNDAGEIMQAVATLVSKPVKADAVLFGSNRIGVHALRYIQEKKIKVPDHLQLIGFDETEVFDFFQPQVSFVKQPMLQLGQKATEILLCNIADYKNEQKIFIPAELIIRNSSPCNNT